MIDSVAPWWLQAHVRATRWYDGVEYFADSGTDERAGNYAMNDRPTADGDLAGVSGILKSINIDGVNSLAAVKRWGPLEDGESVPGKNSRPAVSQSLTGKM